MTKKNAKKSAARARKTTLGGKYQHHLRQVGGGDSNSYGGEATSPGTVGRLLASLRTTKTFNVQVGRLPAVGVSANAAVASAHAAELALHPKYSAKTGAVEKEITGDEMMLLIAAGAADIREVRVLRSFVEDGETFSERCPSCHRWLLCGTEEHEAACVCGQRYRMAFDRSDAWPEHHGVHCMDCGTDMADGQGHAVNDWQLQCDACHTHVAVKAAYANYGKASGDVANTNPVVGDPVPTDVEKLETMARADEELHRAIDAEEGVLRARLGLKPREGLLVQGLVRQMGGVVDGRFLEIRYDLRLGKTLNDAVEAAREHARVQADLLEVGIRRMDRPSHPTVCTWKRKYVGDEWKFTWHHAADDLGAEPLALSTPGASGSRREPREPESEKGLDPYAALDPKGPGFIDPYAALDPKGSGFIDPYGARRR
jgi:hypothetical protein